MARRSSSSSFRVALFLLYLSFMNLVRRVSRHPLSHIKQSLQRPSTAPRDEANRRGDVRQPVAFSEEDPERTLSESKKGAASSHHQQRKQRLLYIVTSMREFDDGERQTTLGNDRFSKTIVPLISEATISMVEEMGYHVDLYLIAYYNVSEKRRNELRARIPESVGVEIWQDAAPLGYARDASQTELQPVTRGLARQHRFVIKDKLQFYDAFVAFEDDMLIKGSHVEHFLNVTNELYNLRQDALDDWKEWIRPRDALNVFHGEMTKSQLERMIPGFIRVEVALDDKFTPPEQNAFPNITIDRKWNADVLHVDPSMCCHLSSASAGMLWSTSQQKIPPKPSVDRIYFWETRIDALGVRKLPDRSKVWDWVIRQAGASGEFRDSKFVIGDFWTGTNHSDQYFGGAPRPKLHLARYNNNQGGWMGTFRQIVELHTKQCNGGFLPPFNLPEYIDDGLDQKSVEHWSGGISIFGPRSCTMQRILTLHPAGFSKHLLYHSSNNKQRAAHEKFYGHSIDDFWGQMNTVRKNAERQMKKPPPDDKVASTTSK